MCGERARTRRQASRGSSRSSSRSAGPIFSAYVTPSSGCGRKLGAGSTSSSSRAAISAATAYTPPASRSPISNASDAAIGPAASRSRTSAPIGAVAATPSLTEAGGSTKHDARPEHREGLLAVLVVGAVDDEQAVEMIELVLDDARRHPLELVADVLGLLVLPLE